MLSLMTSSYHTTNKTAISLTICHFNLIHCHFIVIQWTVRWTVNSYSRWCNPLPCRTNRGFGKEGRIERFDNFLHENCWIFIVFQICKTVAMAVFARVSKTENKYNCCRLATTNRTLRNQKHLQQHRSGKIIKTLPEIRIGLVVSIRI